MGKKTRTTRRKLSFDESPEFMDYNSFAVYERKKTESEDFFKEKRQRAKKILRIAIDNELTQRQKDCIDYYYYQKKPVREIAEILLIKPTTVYKHIRVAKKALKKASLYL